MDPIEPFITAFESIRSSKSRSLLTTLGLLIAVAAVITDASIGAGYEVWMEDIFESLGENLISISPREEGVIQHKELVAIRDLPGVVAASPNPDKTARVKYMTETKFLDVVGVTKEYQQVQNLELEEGSFLSDQDTYAAVVGYDVAHITPIKDKEIFSRDISVQSPTEISITRSNGEKCTATFLVKGILKKKSVAGCEYGNPVDKQIFIPESVLNEMLNVRGYSIVASAESLEEVEEVKGEIENRLDRLLGITENLRVEPPYTIVTMESYLKTSEKEMSGFRSVLFVVALVSLLVGAIGIMNIMLVTVTERTREVGLMKAVGATRLDVLITFLVESSMLGLIGGVLGIAVSVGLCKIMCLHPLGSMPPPVLQIEWIFIGLVVAVAVGVVSGVYPAFKAASMRPLEALRHE